MEMENMVSNRSVTKDHQEDEDEGDDDVPLPGFRFHPTDAELVSFYLRRKVEKRRISIELIKTIDIYKYDPWDLPKGSNVGEKEWYFFCKRGRKYKNSVRPNRVTGCGFWKATGIDKAIYDEDGLSDCIGLKKSLVFYRGSAGKGTKTDWMMHEFRLPAADHHKSSNHFNAKTIPQEAEVWTLCRIFKRSVSNKKIIPEWKEMAAANKRTTPVVTSKTCDMAGIECNNYNNNRQQSYNISFNNAAPPPPPIIMQHEKKPSNGHHHVNNANQLLLSDKLSSISQHPSNSSANSSFMSTSDINQILKHGEWEELSSVVEFATGPLFF